MIKLANLWWGKQALLYILIYKNDICIYIGARGKCAKYWPDCKSPSTGNLLVTNTYDRKAKKGFGKYSVLALGETLVEFDTYRRRLEIIKTEESQ